MSIDEGEWSDLVCPYIKTIRRIHKYLFKPLGIHYFKVLDALNPIFHKRILLHEYWTSPQPKENQNWSYNISTNRIITPSQIELPYLHFLFFKKTPWLKTNLYWQSGFWTLHKPIESYNNILINTKGIIEQ